jgi:uncharacterized protein YbjT (DUF2867 family)
VETLVTDFETWADLPDGPATLAALLNAQLSQVQQGTPRHQTPVHGFCCLGTTIKVAGSQEAFRRVDFGYVVAFAHAMRQLNAAHVGVVSALGASKSSSVFYSRTKGEMEADVAAAGVPSTHFVRPSFIDGNRQEVRSGESLGIAATKLLGPLLIGPLKQYRVIHADRIVAKLISVAAQSPAGVHATNSGALRD